MGVFLSMPVPKTGAGLGADTGAGAAIAAGLEGAGFGATRLGASMGFF